MNSQHTIYFDNLVFECTITDYTPAREGEYRFDSASDVDYFGEPSSCDFKIDKIYWEETGEEVSEENVSYETIDIVAFKLLDKYEEELEKEKECDY